MNSKVAGLQESTVLVEDSAAIRNTTDVIANGTSPNWTGIVTAQPQTTSNISVGIAGVGNDGFSRGEVPKPNIVTRTLTAAFRREPSGDQVASNSPAQSTPMSAEVETAVQIELVDPGGLSERRGVFSRLGRFMRRRVLNYWDKSPTWAIEDTNPGVNTNQPLRLARNDMLVTNRALATIPEEVPSPTPSLPVRVWKQAKRVIPFVSKEVDERDKIHSDKLKVFGQKKRPSSDSRRGDLVPTAAPPKTRFGRVRRIASKVASTLNDLNLIAYYWQYFVSEDSDASQSEEKDEFTAAQSPTVIVSLKEAEPLPPAAPVVPVVPAVEPTSRGGLGWTQGARALSSVYQEITRHLQRRRGNQSPSQSENESQLTQDRLQQKFIQSQQQRGESFKSSAQAGGEIAVELGDTMKGVVRKKRMAWPWEHQSIPIVHKDELTGAASLPFSPITSTADAVSPVVPRSVALPTNKDSDGKKGVEAQKPNAVSAAVSTTGSPPQPSVVPGWFHSTLPLTAFVFDQVLLRVTARSTTDHNATSATTTTPDQSSIWSATKTIAKRVPLLRSFVPSSAAIMDADQALRTREAQHQQDLDHARSVAAAIEQAQHLSPASSQYRTAGIVRDLADMKYPSQSAQPRSQSGNNNSSATSTTTKPVTESFFLSASQQEAAMNFARTAYAFIPALPSIPAIDIPKTMIPDPSSFLFGRDDSVNSTPQESVMQPSVDDTGLPILPKDALKFDRAQELRTQPVSVDIPLPSKADFAFLAYRRADVAIRAARAVKTERDALEYLKDIGLDPLIATLVDKVPFNERLDKVDAVKALSRLTHVYRPLADEIGQRSEVVEVLCDMMEAPLRGGIRSSFRSQQDKDRDARAQHEAVAFVQRLVRSSDVAVESMRHNARLRKVLQTMMSQPEPVSNTNNVGYTNDGKKVKLLKPTSSLNGTTVLVETVPRSFEETKQQKVQVVKKLNSTTIVEYVNLRPSQMARVASWGLGGVPWKPRQPGQKGLRILSFDGGGTRGVLSIACLKEIFARVNRPDLIPGDAFDIICGTSTGGIIAMLFGAQRRSINEAELMYDDLIGKIFASKSNLKLITSQAAYDETEWERILYRLCGESLVLDSNHEDCSRVFCLSSKLNTFPPVTMLWRNYNYPPGQQSRYPGTFRINTMTAVRATTAAPTIFTPVQWEGQLYSDGGLVANNPTAVALQEAKALYPGVPIELVVSIGTGIFVNQQGKKTQSMGWDVIVNQLIVATTDTEDVHSLLTDFLPKEKYFRLNPFSPEDIPIDAKDKSVLLKLKQIARDHYREQESGPDAKYYERLAKVLRGEAK